MSPPALVRLQEWIEQETCPRGRSGIDRALPSQCSRVAPVRVTRWRRKESDMSEMQKSIVLDAPVREVYNQWTQFEEFPQFMEGVVEVRQLDDKRLYWRANIGGAEREWHAEIVDQTPDQRIAWRSLTGSENGGAVLFRPLSDSRTEVTLRMLYNPEGLTENVGDALGFVGRRIQGDLERFREFLEQRGRATGGWRGEIHGRNVQGS